jgi:uncharacterized protein
MTSPAPVTSSRLADPTPKARLVPVSFPNQHGLSLVGMLHVPIRRRDDRTAILLLSPGVKMRVAPHRLYQKMATRFAALGYPVLRFDFHALGDAGGTAPEALLADFYQATQLGRYVGDTIAAMDWFQREHGISRFIVAGLCGGALTGLLTAQRDQRITSLLALSIPVTLDGSAIDGSKFLTDTQLEHKRQRYFRKLRVWDPAVWRSWARFLSGQAHYSLITRALMKPLVATLKPAVATPPAPALDGAAPSDNTNPLFAPALLGMLRARRVLLVFAETDRLLAEFHGKFMQRHTAAFAGVAANCDIHVTPAANHIFSFAEWQQDMLDRCCTWLEAGSAPSAAAGHIARADSLAGHA